MKLNAGQQSLVNYLSNAFLTEGVPGHTILGEGGVGKTTCIMEAVKAWQAQRLNVLLLAPTHKAVNQMALSAKRAGVNVRASTLHSALGLALLPDAEHKYTSKRGEGFIHSYQIVVLDEGSMVSKVALDNYLMPVLRDLGIRMVVMGDSMQLPPVRELESPALELFPATELTKVERYAEDGEVAHLCRGLRRHMDDPETSAGRLTMPDEMEMVKAAKWTRHLADWFKHGTEGKARALAWTNARVNATNKVIRQAIYGKDAPMFVEGEHVIAAAPVIDMETGEVMMVTDDESTVKAICDDSLYIEPLKQEYATHQLCLQGDDGVTFFAHVLHERDAKRYKQDLDNLYSIAKHDSSRHNWRRFHEAKDSLADLRYPYCTTVHRSQGSTFDHVAIDCEDIVKNRRSYERRRLLYVAASRASKSVQINQSKVRW